MMLMTIQTAISSPLEVGSIRICAEYLLILTSLVYLLCTFSKAIEMILRSVVYHGVGRYAVGLVQILDSCAGVYAISWNSTHILMHILCKHDIWAYAH